MGKDDVVDVTDIKLLPLQRVEQQRHAVVYTGINEGRSAALNDQVACILAWARVLGIDGGDTIVEDCGCCSQSAAVVSRPLRRE